MARDHGPEAAQRRRFPLLTTTNPETHHTMPDDQAHPPAADHATGVPRGTLEGLRRYARQDLLSGFLVFLIALPLCLGIALACGFPPIAGVFTAVIGGLLAPWLSDSELTIKGPAAGLIVIVVGCVGSFGGNGYLDGQWTAADQAACQLALGVGVAAAVLQIAFGLLRGGLLGEFFPSSVVHGMLAAIGLTIIAKQFPVMLGLPAKGDPLHLLAAIPAELLHANPYVAAIGLVSLGVMAGWPYLKRVPLLGRLPAPVVALAIAVPMALALGVGGEAHRYVINGQTFELSRKLLVNVPDNLLQAVSWPDFSGLARPQAWYWVMLYAVIGTLESMLSAKAVDMLDPWRRKTDFDRDNTAQGVGNLVAAMVGALPMISEIVRSRANIDNGARTRFANMAHGLFLLGFVAAAPRLLGMIPMAALGAMLVVTGYRLAHPREFKQALEIGWEQLVVFAGTVLAVLATDLLTGVVIGIAIEAALQLVNGAPLAALVSAGLEVAEGDGEVVLTVRRAALFSTWIPIKQRIEGAIANGRKVVIDLSDARLVDHTVMDKLHRLRHDHGEDRVVVIGLDHHRTTSAHPLAARKWVA